MVDANSLSAPGEQEDIAKVLCDDRSRQRSGLSSAGWVLGKVGRGEDTAPYLPEIALLCFKQPLNLAGQIKGSGLNL